MFSFVVFARGHFEEDISVRGFLCRCGLVCVALKNILGIIYSCASICGRLKIETKDMKLGHQTVTTLRGSTCLTVGMSAYYVAKPVFNCEL